MAIYTISHFEELLTTRSIEVEADSLDEAEQKYDQMRYDGSLFEQADLTAETVTNVWAEISYIDDNNDEIVQTL